MGKNSKSARSRSGRSSRAKSARAAGRKSERKAAGKRSKPAKKSAKKSARKPAKRPVGKSAGKSARKPGRQPEPVSLGPIDEEASKPKKAHSRRLSGAERRARIKQAKARLLERREAITSEMRDGIRARPPAPPATKGDSSDLAAEALDSDTAMQLAEGEASELAQIDQALGKVDEGTYGLCETCGEEIPWARLQALPYATRCVKCKERQELVDSGFTGPAGWSAVGDLESFGKD